MFDSCRGHHFTDTEPAGTATDCPSVKCGFNSHRVRQFMIVDTNLKFVRIHDHGYNKYMKTCFTCNQEKPCGSFYKRKSRSGALSSSCIECEKKYRKIHYKNNLSLYKKKARKNDRISIEKNFKSLTDYLKNNPCVDCGEKDVVVLQFDHVRTVKTYNISTMLHRKMSWERILAEIEKCEVRCANCHTRKTAKDFNWKKLQV